MLAREAWPGHCLLQQQESMPSHFVELLDGGKQESPTWLIEYSETSYGRHGGIPGSGGGHRYQGGRLVAHNYRSFDWSTAATYGGRVVVFGVLKVLRLMVVMLLLLSLRFLQHSDALGCESSVAIASIDLSERERDCQRKGEYLLLIQDVTALWLTMATYQ